MIRGYSDHAANERTFLAWVRTGIAVIAFGFVVEKFNLFVLAMASASSPDAGHRLLLERLSGPFGRYDGLALILVGLALVVVAAARFVRTGWLLDDQESRRQRPRRADPVDSVGVDCRRVQHFSRAQLMRPGTKESHPRCAAALPLRLQQATMSKG
jgi:putative membrane protein